jgi:uncharacterized protein involved in propanediol utilization
MPRQHSITAESLERLGSFADAVSAMMESTRQSAHKIYDYLEAQAELGALSVPVAHGMMGALFDWRRKCY